MFSKGYMFCLQVFMSLAVFVTLVGCEGGDDEQAVISVVNDGVALLEDERVTKAMRLTTKDFLVQPAKLNRKAASARLINMVRINGAVSILHPEPDVEILEKGTAALVTLPFVVAKRGVEATDLEALEDNRSAWIEAAEKYTRVETAQISLVKINDRWLIRTIRF